MSLTAMKQALEALEDATKHIFLGDKNGVEANIRAHKQCESLRQAIAATEESSAVQEPVAWLHIGKAFGDVQAFTREPPPSMKAECQPLYTHPQPKADHIPDATKMVEPKREWVGLTDEERHELANVPRWSSVAFVEATEAKLKEKNT